MEEPHSLFLAAEIAAPWPEELPEGRLIEERARHMTLAFFGRPSWESFQPLLHELPLPVCSVGPAACLDALLFLPQDMSLPRLVAGHLEWLTAPSLWQSYHEALARFSQEHGLHADTRPLLSHVTLARAPLDVTGWKEFPLPLPAFAQALHLYESHPGLHYTPRWTHPLLPPFEEFEHTADIAYRVRASSFQELGLHALLALAFRFPPLLAARALLPPAETLDDLILHLNRLLAQVDSETGVPFKAVSHHGSLTHAQIYEWEMIVDV